MGSGVPPRGKKAWKSTYLDMVAVVHVLLNDDSPIRRRRRVVRIPNDTPVEPIFVAQIDVRRPQDGELEVRRSWQIGSLLVMGIGNLPRARICNIWCRVRIALPYSAGVQEKSTRAIDHGTQIRCHVT
jgi:hypothetical protein